jgi:hypothetical protein
MEPPSSKEDYISNKEDYISNKEDYISNNEASSSQEGSSSSQYGWEFNACKEARDIKRDRWDKQFKLNFITVTETISGLIATKILTDIQESFNNPACPDYIITSPLMMSFPLSQIALLEEWSKDTEITQLSPYDEWLGLFKKQQEAKVKLEETKVEQQEVKLEPKVAMSPRESTSSPREFTSFLRSKPGSTPVVKKIPVGTFDVDYFQSKVELIAEEVAETVESKLKVFTSAPENNTLCYNVTWIKKDQRLVVDAWRGTPAPTDSMPIDRVISYSDNTTNVDKKCLLM